VGRNGRESAYRWSQEELEMVYKTGIQPTVYLANK